MCSIGEIPELFVIGRPDMTIVAFGSDVLDIFEVNDILSSRGWHLNALQRPNRSGILNAMQYYNLIYKIYIEICQGLVGGSGTLLNIGILFNQ